VIVRRRGASLWLITQPDHAGLAADLLRAWRADGFPQRPTRDRVITAAGQHDLGWAEVDAAPRVDPATRRPYDFLTAPLELRQPLWPRAVRTLAATDPYVAALVAQHAITVYRRYAGDPAWRSFFPPLERLRDELVVATAKVDTTTEPPDLPGPGLPGLESFLQDYTLVGLSDLFSLIFCNGWTESHAMEGYHAILQGDLLTIAPDPFAGASVPLQVVARILPDRAYESDDDLRHAWATAPIASLKGTAVGAALAPTS
jgi:Protein of unknown function (DUF3891)